MVILVEGDGDKKAIPILLKRAKGLPHDQVLCIDMKGKSNIIRENGFEKTLLRQTVAKATRFIVLLDQDGPHQPYNSLAGEIKGMNDRAQSLQEQNGISITMLWAIKEFESWIVGGLRKGSAFCGLRKVKTTPNDTQSAPADPKVWIMEHCEKQRYDSTAQACLTAHFDITLAARRNQSLREFLARV